jgi:DNA-binding transcriptional MerR regulator
MDTRKTWKVGDLAAETGVSVRALHYYEEIGLLVPSGRTAAGHRVYSELCDAR